MANIYWILFLSSLSTYIIAQNNGPRLLSIESETWIISAAKTNVNSSYSTFSWPPFPPCAPPCYPTHPPPPQCQPSPPQWPNNIVARNTPTPTFHANPAPPCWSPWWPHLVLSWYHHHPVSAKFQPEVSETHRPSKKVKYHLLWNCSKIMICFIFHSNSEWLHCYWSKELKKLED